MFSPDGKRLMWTSSGRTADRKSQLFIADFTLEAVPRHADEGGGALNRRDPARDEQRSRQPTGERQTAMGPKDVIKQTLDTSDFIIKSYVNDLTDADLRLRPVEGMHPIALQLGHLIVAEQMFDDMVKPGSAPPCPTVSRKHTTSRTRS